jgi:hypothetical protein
MLGLSLGALFGALAGLAISVVVVQVGAWAMTGWTLAGAVFGVLIGGFWGGMAGFGPPAEEDDPLPREDRLDVVERREGA